jgi:exosortase
MSSTVCSIDSPSMNQLDGFKKRLLMFSGWILLSSLLFARPLTTLLRMSVSSDTASYLIFIPLISAWILFVDRRKIFRRLSYDPALGGGLLLCAVCLGLVTSLKGGASSFDPRLYGYILALLMLWLAGFTLLFGKAALRSASFPLFFVFLMVPLPQFLLNRVIYLLQTGSAWTTGAFFDLFGVPALREGFVFHLPGVNIEVAEECSGIRSSMALLILALIVAHFYLMNFWSKVLFVISGLFIMILKNGIRIATLTLLAMYVSPSFLTGRLHQQGGIVFFLVGLLLLLPVLWLLQRGESRKSMAGEQSQSLL